MRSPYYARLAAKLLARAPEVTLAPSASQRSVIVLQIESALRKKALRRRQARWAAVVASFAAAAAAVLFIARRPQSGSLASAVVTAIGNPSGSGARVLTASGSEPLLSGAPLLPGRHLVANPDGGAALRLSTGTELTLEHNANLVFSEAGPTEHFILSQGALQARVAKLQAGQRFIISTPDADVEVHGTVFRVAVVEPDPGCSAFERTRVEVLEGIVEVRSRGESSYVHPGEHWPAACATSLAASATTAAPHEEPPPAAPLTSAFDHPAPTARRALAARPHAAVSAEPVSEAARALAKAQNELFSQGIAARRSGDSATALGKFQALQSQFPNSPLAESAAAERMRTLALGNPAAARRAAREYLARYPRGFAVSDADSILAGR